MIQPDYKLSDGHASRDCQTDKIQDIAGDVLSDLKDVVKALPSLNEISAAVASDLGDVLDALPDPTAPPMSLHLEADLNITPEGEPEASASLGAQMFNQELAQYGLNLPGPLELDDLPEEETDTTDPVIAEYANKIQDQLDEDRRQQRRERRSVTESGLSPAYRLEQKRRGRGGKEMTRR